MFCASRDNLSLLSRGDQHFLFQRGDCGGASKLLIGTHGKLWLKDSTVVEPSEVLSTKVSTSCHVFPHFS